MILNAPKNIRCKVWFFTCHDLPIVYIYIHEESLNLLERMFHGMRKLEELNASNGIKAVTDTMGRLILLGEVRAKVDRHFQVCCSAVCSWVLLTVLSFFQ